MHCADETSWIKERVRQLKTRVEQNLPHDNNILLEKELRRLENILRERGYDSRNMSIDTEYEIDGMDELARREHERMISQARVKSAIVISICVVSFVLLFVVLRYAFDDPEKEKRELAWENHRYYGVPVPPEYTSTPSAPPEKKSLLQVLQRQQMTSPDPVS